MAIPNALNKTVDEAVAVAQKIRPNIDPIKLKEAIDKVFSGQTTAEAIQLPPDRLDFLCDCGIQFYKNGKFEDARSCFELLSDLNPNEPRYAIALGHCYYKMDDVLSAIPYYLRATYGSTKTPNAYYYLGDCYMKLNDPFFAYYNYQKFLDEVKNNSHYKSLIDQVKVLMESISKKITNGELLKTLNMIENL